MLSGKAPAKRRGLAALRRAIGSRLFAQCLGSAAALAMLSLGSAPAFAAPAQAVASHPLAPHVAEAAQRFGIPEHWIWAVMRQESGGNPRAVSPVGAQGLMQIMPGTWAMLTTRFDLGANAFEPRANIMAGAAYLRLMWDRYRNVRLMLAAYNAGPGRVDAYAAGRRGLPLETVNYVARISSALGAPGAPAMRVPATSVEPSWRDADLFAKSSGDAPRAGDDAAGPAPSPPPPTQSQTLFVPVSSSR